MGEIELSILVHPHGKDLPLPSYQTAGSSGLDLMAACENEIVLNPGERTLVPTGISFSLPEGYEAQIRPRSGLAIKNGVTLLNTPGTIDSDYRGEIMVILHNRTASDCTIARGDRIAQGILLPVSQAAFEEVTELSETQRGSSGFGSTG